MSELNNQGIRIEAVRARERENRRKEGSFRCPGAGGSKALEMVRE